MNEGPESDVARTERLELLGAPMLETRPSLVTEFKRLARRFGISLGWHYLLDLSWAATLLESANNALILDAGGGTGVMQWWLAGRGAHVTSVDRLDRTDLSARFRIAYWVCGHRPGDLLDWSEQIRRRWGDRSVGWPSRLASTARSAVGWLLSILWPKPNGRVVIHHADLADMRSLQDAGFDAVVSISALEHNSATQLRAIIRELLRVLKPGGRIIATLGATDRQSWLHEPSDGWCYSERDLRAIFDLGLECPSNFDHFDELMRATRDSRELQDGLARAYFSSGDNGMPWGVWDPKYLPVGVVKVKHG